MLVLWFAACGSAVGPRFMLYFGQRCFFTKSFQFFLGPLCAGAVVCGVWLGSWSPFYALFWAALGAATGVPPTPRGRAVCVCVCVCVCGCVCVCVCVCVCGQACYGKDIRVFSDRKLLFT